MKKIFTGIVAAILPLLSYAAEGDTFVYQGLTYSVIDATAKTVKTVPGTVQIEEALIIPPSVEYNNETYTVTEIGESSFKDCRQITYVDIPNTVTYIGEEAFMWCSEMTAVTLGNSISKIDREAFAQCDNLSGVNIADIASWCNIEFAFYYSNPLYYAHDIYMEGMPVTELNVPESVTSIQPYAFMNATCLTSVTLPSTLLSIGDDTFNGCTGLTSMEIPASVKKIGNGCFDQTNVSRLEISDLSAWCQIEFLVNPLVRIGSLYLNGEELTELTIPDNISVVLPYAFQGCTSLKSVKIPNTVTIIDYAAFDSCSELETVDLGENVTFIGESAFEECMSLKEIRIPDSVITIDEDAFADCSSLTDVIIGKSVETIGDEAFHDCDALTTITVLAENPPVIDEETFSNFNAQLIVPEGSVEKYKNDPIWGKFANIGSGVNEIMADGLSGEKAIYTLDGTKLPAQPVETLPSGVYVVGGKKVLVK